MAIMRVRTVITGPPGAPYLSTMYFAGATSSPTSTEAQAAGDAVRAFWVPLAADSASGITYQVQPEVAVIETTGVQTGAFAISEAAIAGAGSTQLLPPSNQALVKWFTGIFTAGRQLTGRTFIPSLRITDVSNGSLTSTKISLIQGAVNTLNAITNPLFGIWSREHVGFGGASSGVVQATVAVLKSRRD